MYQLSFSLEQFLAQYWQKKPTIIKQGFANFVDPMSAEELAGLTLEQEVDSRFVSNANGQWQAEHGPFGEEKFAELPQRNWSFIVQAANHWHPASAELIEPFKLMPNWLFDDLMISYSVEGGGVGPHIDQYDVFIVQGQGRRHWRVGALDQGQYVETNNGSGLRQIEQFEPIIDEVLEPGDILYIPPGFPHDGYALEPSMSYSVGFRSPKEQELVSNFADYILAHDKGDVHWHQPNLQTQDNFGKISQSALNDLSEMLTKASNDKAIVADFMGCLLSQSRHQLNIIPSEKSWTVQDLIEHLTQGGELYKVSGLRALFHENNPNTLFINGEVFKIEGSATAMGQVLCSSEQLSLHQMSIEQLDIELLCKLINRGYWFAE